MPEIPNLPGGNKQPYIAGDSLLIIETVDGGNNNTGYCTKDQLFAGAAINSIAVGPLSNTTADGAIAVGDSAFASDIGAISIGQDSDAIGFRSVAIGQGTQALDVDAIAIGDLTAAGNNSVAVGSGCDADGIQSVAICDEAQANNQYVVAIGRRAGFDGNEYAGIYIGVGASGGDRAIAMGDNPDASGNRSIAMSFNAVASGDRSIAIGNATDATGNRSIAFGGDAQSLHDWSVAIGHFAETDKTNQLVFGGQAQPITEIKAGDGTSALTHANPVGFAQNVVTPPTLISASTILTVSQYRIQCDTGDTTLTLPAVPLDGQTYKIRNTSNGDVTLDRNGKTMEGNGQNYKIEPDGWVELAYSAATGWWAWNESGFVKVDYSPADYSSDYSI